jgi:hypothetical protein
MAKLSRSELKGIVKECLMEILSEGLGDASLDLNESSRPRKRKTSTRRVDRSPTSSPALDNIKFSSAVENTVSRATNDPLMASLLADTASTTLQEQINHSDESPLTDGGSSGIPLDSDSLDIFSDASQNWADLAFSSSKNSAS